MKTRNKRLVIISAALILLGGAVTLVLSAFKQNLVFFLTPTQVIAGETPKGKSFRLGGMVEKNSVKRLADGVTVSFFVTDMAQHVQVQYKGMLPDLFKEGKGVVTQGKLGPGQVLMAEEVLAKHDENYMPPEAAYAMQKAKDAKAAQTQVKEMP
jgi:cytochrome c-type biogenesis protein CcmE